MLRIPYPKFKTQKPLKSGSQYQQVLILPVIYSYLYVKTSILKLSLLLPSQEDVGQHFRDFPYTVDP